MTQNKYKTYPYWHQTTLGRLESILKHGLLSQNLAKKLGIKGYRRKFKSSWNQEYVSLMADQSSRKVTAPHVAILVSRNIKVIKAKGLNQKDDTNRPVPKEVLVKESISPENFVGIAIGEVGYSFKLEKPVKPRPIKIEKVIEIIKRTNSNLPIYFKGKRVY